MTAPVTRLGRPALAALGLLLVGAVSACGLLPGVGGTGTEGSTEGSSPSSTSTARPTELPVDLRECPPEPSGSADGDDKGDGEPIDLRAVPLAGWEVSTPDGFVERTGFVQFAPIEGDHDTLYLVPGSSGFPNVLSIAHYPQLEQGLVTDGCGRLDPDAVTARIALQLERSGETVVEGPELTEVAGAPAWRVRGDARGYEIDNYFVYGHDELLHIECQWTDDEAAIAAGCESLLSSLRW